MSPDNEIYMIRVDHLKTTKGDPVTGNFSIDKIIDICPLCHNGIKPIFLNVYLSNDHSYLYVVFSCPIKDCDKLFHSTYARDFHQSSLYNYWFSKPKNIPPVQFDEYITDISPDFCKIYNESNIAQGRDLLNIAGPGYRKALEFLVKDYIIHLGYAEEEDVKQKTLGNCINEYIDDKVLKDLFRKTSWIGNDETHYHRKWVGHDIGTLKDLIDITIAMITTDNKRQSILNTIQ